MNVVVVCPSCRGDFLSSVPCSICRGDGFVKARLWTDTDQKRRMEPQKAYEEAKHAWREAREARKARRYFQNHWCGEPLPEGWVTRHSTSHGCVLATRGNVRVVRGGRDFRIEVRDAEARAWVPHRVTGKSRTRVYQTRVLSRAYETANSLCVPRSGEEQSEADERNDTRNWIELNADALRKFPHPSRYHANKTLYDWAVWILENRPTEIPRVKQRVSPLLQPMPILNESNNTAEA